MDENGKTVYSEFSEKTYKADSDNHFYSFPYTSKFINKELTAQPVFKIFGREILASPSIPLSLEALPITLEANSDSDRATVYGRIDFPLEIETYESLDWNDSEIGFEYSSNPYLNENANRVVCNVGDKGTFSAVIEELQPDNTYYYRAFITTGDETTYGDTESFTTMKPEEEIDLGLSVNWSICNIGAELVNERGNLYSWGEIEPKNSYSWATYFDNPYSSADEWKGCAINFDISGDDRYDPSVSLEDG